MERALIPRSTQGLSQAVFDTGRMANSGLYYGVSIKKPAVSSQRR